MFLQGHLHFFVYFVSTLVDQFFSGQALHFKGWSLLTVSAPPISSMNAQIAKNDPFLVDFHARSSMIVCDQRTAGITKKNWIMSQ